jgi:hypothetical protein
LSSHWSPGNEVGLLLINVDGFSMVFIIGHPLFIYMVLTYFMKTAIHKFAWFFHGFYHRAPTFHLHGIDILYEDCYSMNLHGFSVVFIIGPPFEIYMVFQLQKCQVISKLFTVFLHNNFLQTFYWQWRSWLKKIVPPKADPSAHHSM